MASMVPCPECNTMVRLGGGACPYCNARLGGERSVAWSAGAMVVLGVMLAGCPGDDSSDTMGDEGTATAPTSETMGTESSSASASASASASDTATVTESASDSLSTGALYGPVETSDFTTGLPTTGTDSGTGTDTDTDTDTDTGTDSSTGPGNTTGPQPLYGAADPDE